nr:unnamed protein product [Digitaria exilis]
MAGVGDEDNLAAEGVTRVVGTAYALALHAADVARAELDRRDAQALHARAAASVRVAVHDARFARALAAIPGGPKPVDGFVGGREVLEGMALMEGLHAALGLGIHRVEVLIDYRPLYNHMLGIWYATQKKVADMVDQVLSVMMEFEQSFGCISVVCCYRCGYEFCYTCGKEWKEKKATCSCPLWEESNIIHDDNGDDYYDEEEYDYYYEDDDEKVYLGEWDVL